MATPQQQAANQANAQHSTGPQSPLGKARASLNARKHALCAKDILVATEEKEEFDLMAVGYDVEIDPQGPIEQTIFDSILGASWNMRRIGRMETEACAGHATYADMLADEALQKNLERLARHRTRFERTFHRCMKEMSVVQTQRRKDDATFLRVEAFIESKVAERTQSLVEKNIPAGEFFRTK